MTKSNEFLEGFKAALNQYSWIDNNGVPRIGITGILLTAALAKADADFNPVVIPEVKAIKEKPEPEEIEEPHKKSHHKGQY